MLVVLGVVRGILVYFWGGYGERMVGLMGGGLGDMRYKKPVLCGR